MKKIIITLALLICLSGSFLFAKWGETYGTSDIHGLTGWDSLLNGLRQDTFTTLYGNILSIRDSLYIPRFSSLPASGTIGLFGMDTSKAETVLCRGKTSNLIIYPQGGGIMSQNQIIDTLANGIGIHGGSYTSILAGGDDNNITATTTYSSIIAGRYDTVLAGANYSFIGGGQRNKIYGLQSTIIGGYDNKIDYTADYSGIVAGSTDSINSSNGDCCFIGGGQGNAVNNGHCGIIGGLKNKTTSGATYSFIGGGQDNYITTAGTFIVGGRYDTASTGYGGCVGGYRNYCGGSYSVIIGGVKNKVINTSYSNTIIGGSNNIIRGDAGDSLNYALGSGAVIDSCMATFTFNMAIKKLDSTFAISKWLYTNSNSIAGKVVNGGGDGRWPVYIPGLDVDDIAVVSYRNSTGLSDNFKVSVWTKTDTLVIEERRQNAVDPLDWISDNSTDTIQYHIIRK